MAHAIIMSRRKGLIIMRDENCAYCMQGELVAKFAYPICKMDTGFPRFSSDRFETSGEWNGFRTKISAVAVSDGVIDYHARFKAASSVETSALALTMNMPLGESGDVVVDAVKKETGAYGYDALTNTYGDMFKSGIVDPAKVTRSALENAASVSSMLLTTEAAVVEIPEEKAPQMPDMSGMGGGMGMM